MFAFTYHRPSSVRRAAALVASAEDGKLLAGGQTLLPTLKLRLAAPGDLVDLGAVPDLSGISLAGRTLTIGAMTRHAEVAASPVVRAALPALADLAAVIGDPQVRNRGTLGGSVANNDPSADYPAACLGLGATIITNQRRIEADDFFLGLFETALEPGEIITRIAFPAVKKAAYVKFRHPASRFAMVGVFAAKRTSDIRVAVTGASQNGVFRWQEAEQALRRRFAGKTLDGMSPPADDMVSDIHGSGEYRAHLVGVIARRAVEAAADA
ncbi:xanthine dehydrogenase family protein subunit M [Ancylobacter sp. 6x-1]|uniref:Xanthine dehydrogenase family protein subunit M n=1 Tax=Ancylobacter crimeensis TaxID=2579147 RepID=A0ABT0DG00_9HYPH|nr:xanthine dehydrogenase family protein subunit M [Ancylobacter crimeensis]MCK0198814.1 xanthine dehydrogenase family protein subunit M [Ancylobacter crimeensis]